MQKRTLSLIIITCSFIFTYAQGKYKSVNTKTAALMESYFENSLKNDTTGDFKSTKTIRMCDISHYQQSVWKIWQNANSSFSEEKLPPLRQLDSTAVGYWHLPEFLEPDATMPFYYGKKTSENNSQNSQAKTGSLPLYLYLHGSGPKSHEWSTGLKLAKIFDDAPSAYFIPQIPNEGSYYRWWQRSKQWAWEKLLRQSLASDDINPNRIYVFGISEGGYGSQRLASFYADYLAAAGPMAGGEPLRNAPVENCANIGFSFLTGADDNGFFRNRFTRATKQAFDSLQAIHPQLFEHRIELIPGRGHGIDYRPTTPWLSQHTRNPYPKHIMWEDFAMDGRHRRGFYNLRIDERQKLDSLSRSYYTIDIDSNTINIGVQTVTYEILELDPYWHTIEMSFRRHYTPATSGRFTLFLNENLVDLSKKVTVIVNGKKRFEGKLTPQLKYMAESVATFYDPCRIYPVAVQLSVEDSK